MTAATLRPSHRVTNTPPYAFATIGQEVQALNEQGADIIRLDIGNPDLPPPAFIIESLVEKSRAATTHGYAGYAGIPALRAAMATYYQQRYNVPLDPKTEVLALIGSKEGIANMNMAWLDPGDLALVPDPAYATYATGAQMIGADFYPMPLTLANNWLPDFDAIPVAVAEKARLLWLNYPNNPTGAVADLAFFEEAVAFCRKYNILLCHDNAYGDVTFDGYQAVSALQVPGAKEVVIELNSLSKTYNMAGWRVGMAVGNAVAVQALASIKTQIDSGFALPIQHMAMTALTGSQEWLVERNQVYQRRRDKAIAALAEIDIVVPAPKATFYIWFPVLPGYTDLDFQRKLLHEAHLSVGPGSMYGEQGRNWMRLAIGVPDDRFDEALARLKRVQW